MLTQVIVRAIIVVVCLILGCAHVNNTIENYKNNKPIGASVMFTIMWIFFMARAVLM